MNVRIPINHTCSCGTKHQYLPARFILADNGDELDGAYFDCETCHSTVLVPKAAFEELKAA